MTSSILRAAVVALIFAAPASAFAHTTPANAPMQASSSDPYLYAHQKTEDRYVAPEDAARARKATPAVQAPERRGERSFEWNGNVNNG